MSNKPLLMWQFSEETTTDPEKITVAQLEALCEELLFLIGENPKREGLQDTPRRWAKHWLEFANYDAGKIGTVFENESGDQLVTVSGVRVWSKCEHHLLPFWADVSIGYIPDDSIIGLSKLARIAHKHANRLQVQERMVSGIADEISAITGSGNVAVVARGVHTCMCSRGVRSDGIMSSADLRGTLRTNDSLKQEFYRLIE